LPLLGLQNRDNSVGKVVVVRAWGQWIMVRFHGGRRICCSVHEIGRSGFRFHPTPYSEGARDTFAGVKRSKRAANHAGPLIPRLRMNGPITPFLRVPWLAQGPRLHFRELFKLAIIWAIVEDGCSQGYCAVDSGRNRTTFRWILLPASWRLITQRRYTSSTVLVEATGLSETSVRSYRTAQCHYRTATSIFTAIKPPSLNQTACVLKTITVYLCCITKVTVHSICLLNTPCWLWLRLSAWRCWLLWCCIHVISFETLWMVFVHRVRFTLNLLSKHMGDSRTIQSFR